MTRLTYGADTQGPTWNATLGTFAPLANLTFWTAATGGTQITDLLNSVGGAVTSITSLADGTVPQFSGPNTGQGSAATPGMWVSGGASERLFYNSQGGGIGGGGGGGLLPANNLSDVSSLGTSRYNLHITFSAVQACGTANQASLTGALTIDGYVTGNSDIFLLVGQTTASQNGLWQRPASGTGAWVRPAEFPAGGVVQGRVVLVNGGSSLAGHFFILATTGALTIDTDAESWLDDDTSLALIASTGALSDGGGRITDSQVPDGNVIALLWNGTTATTPSGTTVSSRPGDSHSVLQIIGGPAATPPSFATTNDIYLPTS